MIAELCQLIVCSSLLSIRYPKLCWFLLVAEVAAAAVALGGPVELVYLRDVEPVQRIITNLV